MPTYAGESPLRGGEYTGETLTGELITNTNNFSNI